MRKLIFYTHSLQGGGAERVWANLASGFFARGDEVLFVQDFDAPENARFLAPGIRRVTLGKNHLVAIWRLWRLLRREECDACLSALSISNLKLAVAALLAGRLDRAILSYHGFAEAEPQKLSNLSYRLTPLLTRLAAWTVCVSDALRDDLLRRWSASRARTVRIYNPVEPHPLARVALDERDPLVLSVGRLAPAKNFPALVRAFSRTSVPDARLVILGEGPERPAIEAEIARQNLGDRVSLPGYCDPGPYYAQARCFAATSTSESFGLAIAEALSQGLPVVSTDCGGPREILGDGAYGELVPIGDDDAFANALTAALENPGDIAPRVARSRIFSRDAALDAFAKLIDGRRPKSEARDQAPHPV
jgi:glycosyltransferase involved in cell wall biosynthesis